MDLIETSQPLELTQPDPLEASLLVEPDGAGSVYSESGGESISLSSEEDEEDDSFSPRTASPMAVSGACTSSPSPAVSVDLHEACRRAAVRLNIEWPESPVETATSRYEGKRLPRAEASTSLLLPAFPECLDEATRSWRNPLSAKIPVQRWIGVGLGRYGGKGYVGGFSHLPLVKPLLASHLHPTQWSPP